MMVEGSTMIIIAGVLCFLHMLPIQKTFLVAILGAFLGDQLWYWIGRLYAPMLLKKFPSLKPKIQKLSSHIQKRGDILSFSGRFIYSGAILFPFTLGMYRFSYKRFFIFDGMGVTLWSFLGIGVGYLLGTGAEYFFGKMRKVWHLLAIIAIIIAVVILVKTRFIKQKGP